MYKLAKCIHAIWARLRSLLCFFLFLRFLPRWLRNMLFIIGFAGALVYLSLFIIIDSYAKQLLENPPTQTADAALILGNRAYLNNRPNPCLTGRVDEGLKLAEQHLVTQLVMSGGLDIEDNRIEAVTMESYAKNQGFQGPVFLESRSSSTMENLKFSRPIIEAAGIKSVIITSEPYHMWRVKKLIDAGHFGNTLNVSYAAAPSQCWATWGMLFKGALREPLAIISNYAKGYF